MKRLLPTLGKVLLVTIFLCIQQNVSAQQWASTKEHIRSSYKQEVAPKKALRSVLKDLETKYNISFGYLDKAIENKFIQVEELKGNSIEEILDNLLPSLGLQYTKMRDGFYLIQEAKKPAGQSSTSNEIESSGVSDQAVVEVQEEPVQSNTVTTTRSRTIDFEVSGTVTDASDNSPVPGVNVLVKGTTYGTTTDVNGKFTVNAPNENSVLVFSFIGYISQEVAINSQSVINIKLQQDVQELSEVVVVGYGTMKKSDVTGAISSISQKDISSVRAVNVVESMQGKVAGVDMTRSSGRAGAGYNILVRGTRSLTASNDPLYIVDGIQYTSNVDINPNDVESIEILKDASSTAVYGARGANGVIIITTKRGKSGQSKVSFNTYHGVTMPNGKLPIADREYYLNFMTDLAWMEAIGTNWNNIPARDPNGYQTQLQSKELEGVAMGIDYDWYDKVLKNGSQHDYNLTFSGGSEKLIYSVSLNHYLEDGLIEQDQFKRYNLRVNLESPVKKFLTIGTNTLITFYQQKLRDNPLGLARQASPLVTPFVDSEGNMIADADGPDGVNVFLAPYPNSPLEVYSNPLITANPDYHYNENMSGKVFTTAYATLTFLKDFSFKTSINTEIDYLRRGRFNGVFEGLNGISTASAFNRFSTNYQWQNILSYNKDLTEDHRIQLTAVNEALFRRSELNFTSVQNLNLENSQWYSLYNSNTPGGANITPDLDDDGPSLNKRTLLSYMGRIFYSFKGKYSLQLSGRYDGASQLQDKWSFFPSASVAWNVNEEEFMKSISFLSNLKIRAGYGVSGNYDIDPYSTLGVVSESPLYYSFGNSEVPYNGYSTSRAGNATLGWERTSAINLGIDFGLAGDRIQGSLDLYKTNTDDLLLDQTLSPASGILSVTANVGSTQNKGIELSLRTINVKTNDWTWSTNFTFYRNLEEITGLASGQQKDIANGWFVGYPRDVFFNKKMIGIWQLDELDEAINNSAQPGDIKFQELGEDDRMILGTRRPDWTGGVNSTLQFRNWDLNVLFFARVGHMIRDRAMSTLQPDGRTNQMKLNYWTPDNFSNEVPRLDPGRTNSGYTDLVTLEYTDGSFVKIRDITLGFSFPASMIESLGLSRLRLYATAKNPIIFGKFFNDRGGRWDPELEGTIDIPMPKMYALGLSVEF